MLQDIDVFDAAVGEVLNMPQSIQFHRMICFNSRMKPFIPGRKILVDKLEPPLNHPLVFWKGGGKRKRRIGRGVRSLTEPR